MLTRDRLCEIGSNGECTDRVLVHADEAEQPATVPMPEGTKRQIGLEVVGIALADSGQ